MRVFIAILLTFSLLFACQQKEKPTKTNDIEIATKEAIKKLNNSIIEYGNAPENPRFADSLNRTHFVPSRDWTSGFYPGCLWYLYELTNDTIAKKAAEHYTANIEAEKFNGRTHDMGFKMYCSYGNGYRLTKNPHYKEVLLQSAKTLISRYNPEVGCIRSWDHHADVWQFPVIIDNMMNLELLMWAYSETNDSIYYNIAVSHANTTIKNHFREDLSTYHVVDYDTITGEVIQKNTHQGYAHESAWARGQAWGLYGYTMMYRETKLNAYLEQAEKIADYILSNKNMPADMVPYWDFDDPNIPEAPRDASAAAIASSALFELSSFSNNSEKYLSAANKILSSLCSEKYMAENEAEHNFILEHSTGNLPANSEIDEPIIYADYYFMEALIRKTELENNL